MISGHQQAVSVEGAGNYSPTCDAKPAASSPITTEAGKTLCVGDVVIVYAGHHYGRHHVVTKTAQNLLQAYHEQSGQYTTCNVCDVEKI